MSDTERRHAVAVYIRKDDKVLLGLRKSKQGRGTWCSPGGHIEEGESTEDAARREVHEETGLEIDYKGAVMMTNHDFEDGTKYTTWHCGADWKSGEPQLMEPDNFERWEWFSWDNLPEPLFLPMKLFVETANKNFFEK